MKNSELHLAKAGSTVTPKLTNTSYLRKSSGANSRKKVVLPKEKENSKSQKNKTQVKKSCSLVIHESERQISMVNLSQKTEDSFIELPKETKATQSTTEYLKKRFDIIKLLAENQKHSKTNFPNLDPRLLRKYTLVEESLQKSFVDPSNLKECPSDCQSADLGEESLLLFFLYQFSTSSLSVIGSVCGIMIVTLIAARHIFDNIFNAEVIISKNEFAVFDTIVTKLSRLLTISRGEVFSIDDAA